MMYKVVKPNCSVNSATLEVRVSSVPRIAHDI